MDKKKRNFIISGVLTLVAILFTILVKFIDVKAVGASGSDIGFATINKFIFDLIGTNDLFYTITKYLGYVPLLLVMFYGLVGLKQLVKEKNIRKVDKEILILGGFYVVVAVLYVFFEKCIINYRPILIEGELEASYPSSHTLMTICFCISAIIMNKDYIKKEFVKPLNVFLIILTVIVVIGRLISGVHWFTDIIGGCLISAAVLMCFYSILECNKTYKLKDRTKKKMRK